MIPSTNLIDCNILLMGLLKTSRTETLETYLHDKANSLTVIGLMSPFAPLNEARCTIYQKGKKVKEFPLLNFTIKKITPWNRPLKILSFIIYIYSVFITLLKLHRKFEIFIGIATFSTMIGLFLKKVAVAKKVIYYCIDYYPPVTGYDRIEIAVIRKIDRWAIKTCDVIWSLSPRIKEARELHAKIPANSYKEIIVPLGYTNDVIRNYAFKERERWTLGFIGTISENQGMQLVIKALPLLMQKFPEIKVRIIGYGPFVVQLREIAKYTGVYDKVIFHGYINNDHEAYDILSRCMIGLAPWTGDEKDNSLYTDPGKPKLYAMLGLPIIITSSVLISQLIANTNAGEVIRYSVNDFVSAVEKIISNEEGYQMYRNGVERFRSFCKAECIFNQALAETFDNR